MQFLSLEKLGGDFMSLLYSVRGGRPTSAFSLAPGAKIHVAAELKSKVLFVTADSLQAKDVAKKFNRYFGREAAVYLPSRDDVLLYKKVGNRALYAERSFALAKILKGEAQVAVVSAETLEQYLPDREEFEKSVLTINVGDEITPQKWRRFWRLGATSAWPSFPAAANFPFAATPWKFIRSRVILSE